jgi:3-deoxy-manno-octulosonate cytidylyltransferase (CMP-KDO synthetase)
MMDIAGKPLILHTLERTLSARSVSGVLVATDNKHIFDSVNVAGGQAVMTSSEHLSGSDRIAEVAESLPHGSLIVNVQGDEPLISPSVIDRAVGALLSDDSADIATVSEAMKTAADVLDPNIVKVVTDEDGYALYFSRSPVPFPREAVMRHGTLADALDKEPELLASFRKHTGLYVYRREFLLRFTKWPPSRLEQIERLEQLRALENGAKIKVVSADEASIGVDTAEDLDRVRNIVEANG